MRKWRGNWVVQKPGHIRHGTKDIMIVDANDREAATNLTAHTAAARMFGDEKHHTDIQVFNVNPAS